jgi:hypothetical protein
VLLKRGSSCASGVRLACGGRILEFTDTAHYQAVYDCLEQEYEAHQDWALGQYGQLNDEAYNDILDSIGFNDDEPLQDFEQCLGFSSYRRLLWTMENAWLASGMDPNLDPDNVDNIDDPITATLMSEERAIKIGGIINYLDDQGNWYTVQNGDCSLLDSLIACASCVNNPNVLKNTYDTPCGDCWYLLGWSNDEFWHNNKRKVKWKWDYDLDQNKDIQKFVLVQKSYRKRLFVWNRFRINQTINMTAELLNHINCNDLSSMNVSRSDRWWRVKLTYSAVSPFDCWLDCIPYARFSSDCCSNDLTYCQPQ